METSKKASTFWCGKVMIGGAAGTRTPYLYNAIVALSQMSYSPRHPAAKRGRRVT